MFKQKKLSAGARLGIGFLSSLLSIALFISVVFTGVVVTVREVISEDNVKNFVAEILTPSEDSDDPSGLASELTEKAIDTYYEDLEEELGDDLPFEDKEEFKQILKESTANDYISEKVAGLITDYFNGEVTTKFDADEVMDLIEENEDLIVEITGQPLPDDIRDTVAEAFEENEIIQKVEKKGLMGLMDTAEEDIFELPEWLPLIGGMTFEDIMDAFRDFVSEKNLITGILVSVVLALLIVLINIRQLPKGLRRVSYPVLIAGLPVILNILAESDLELWEEPILGVLRSMLRLTTPVNVTIFGIGAVLLIGGIVLGIIFKVKKIGEILTPAAPVPAAGPAVNYAYAPASAPVAPAAPAEPVVPVAPAEPVVPVAEVEEPAPVETAEPAVEEELAPAEEAAEEPVAEEALPVEEAVPAEEAAPVAE